MAEQVIDLNGKRLIVVEDNYSLAVDICRELRSLGATVLGPAPTPFYALQLIGVDDRHRIDAAVLDVHLHGTTVFPVAEVLYRRGIPFVFTTGEDPKAIPHRFRHAPVLQKPLSKEVVAAAVIDLVRYVKPASTKSPLPPLSVPIEPPVVHFARALARGMGNASLIAEDRGSKP